MSTTQLFVEHLIAGAFTLFGILIITIAITGFNPAMMQAVMDYQALLAIGSTALMYPLGIFTDNLSDEVLKGKNEKLRKKHKLNEGRITAAKLIAQLDNDSISRHFAYSRMKIRISRAAIFNFAFVSFSLAIFFLARGSEFPSIIVWVAVSVSVLIGATLSLFAYWNWYTISNNHHKLTARIWNDTTEIRERS